MHIVAMEVNFIASSPKCPHTQEKVVFSSLFLICSYTILVLPRCCTDLKPDNVQTGDWRKRSDGDCAKFINSDGMVWFS